MYSVSYFYPHCTDKEIEAQADVLTCLKARDRVIKPQCEPKLVKAQSLCLHCFSRDSVEFELFNHYFLLKKKKDGKHIRVLCKF